MCVCRACTAVRIFSPASLKRDFRWETPFPVISLLKYSGGCLKTWLFYPKLSEAFWSCKVEVGELQKQDVKPIPVLFVQIHTPFQMLWALKVEERVKMHFNTAERAWGCSMSAHEP